MSAYGPESKPLRAWLPYPDPNFDRSPHGHIRAGPATANGALVNSSAPVATRGSKAAQGPAALLINPQSYQHTAGYDPQPERRP